MKIHNESKAGIIENLKRNTKVVYPKPDLTFTHEGFENKLQEFLDICNNSGGRSETLHEGESIDEAIKRLFPDAKSIACNVEGLTCGTFDADQVATPGELNGTDLVVCQGLFGVCENGAVYFEQTYKQRAIYFIAEAMILIVPKEQLVDTMHEAMERIPVDYPAEFRGFIAGPSKTADIEQALVKGAHGPKECIMLVV